MGIPSATLAYWQMPVAPLQLPIWQGLVEMHWLAMVQTTWQVPLVQTPELPLMRHVVPFCTGPMVGTPATQEALTHELVLVGALVSSATLDCTPPVHTTDWQSPTVWSAAGAGPSASGVCTQTPSRLQVSVVHGSPSSH